ncbi:MAG TPA: guanylate kinase [Thermomicrobiales bacterium]|nr:guanylate kinase [Thermomicrobiales bacterium]
MADVPLEETTEELTRHSDALIAEIRAVARPRLFVISGPSGVGKDTVIDELRGRLPEFHFAVTATTRERRPGEMHGVHYFFMSVEDFHAELASGEFVESAEVYGNWYGVPRRGIQGGLDSGRHVIVKVDVQGAATIRALAPDAISIFLMPTSMEDLTRRLWHRKTDGPQVVMRRVRTAAEELKAVVDFDYAVFNEEGKLSKTLDEIMAIIIAEQRKVTQRETLL